MWWWWLLIKGCVADMGFHRIKRGFREKSGAVRRKWQPTATKTGHQGQVQPGTAAPVWAWTCSSCVAKKRKWRRLTLAASGRKTNKWVYQFITNLNTYLNILFSSLVYYLIKKGLSNINKKIIIWLNSIPTEYVYVAYTYIGVCAYWCLC